MIIITSKPKLVKRCCCYSLVCNIVNIVLTSPVVSSLMGAFLHTSSQSSVISHWTNPCRGKIVAAVQNDFDAFKLTFQYDASMHIFITQTYLIAKMKKKILSKLN